MGGGASRGFSVFSQTLCWAPFCALCRLIFTARPGPRRPGADGEMETLGPWEGRAMSASYIVVLTPQGTHRSASEAGWFSSKAGREVFPHCAQK